MFSDIAGYAHTEANSVAMEWVNSQTYDVIAACNEVATSETVWVEIAKNAHFDVLVCLAGNPCVSDKVLFAMLLNDSLSLSKSYHLSVFIARHPNCSSETLSTLYSLIHRRGVKRGTTVLKNIAAHPNTPEYVVMDLLPNSYANRSRNLCAENVEACYSESIPASVALKASYRLKDYSFHQDSIWAKQYPRFVVEYGEKTGVDISDWPEEWVHELVKQKKIF